MTPKIAVRYAFAAAVALTALAAVAPVPVAAAEVVCRANYDFCVEVNGAYPPDARFFVADARGKFLVDIPSQAKSVLIDLPTRRAIAVPRATIKPDGTDGIVRVADPGPSGSPAYALSIEGPVLRFQADDAKVRVLKVTERAPMVGVMTLDALVADRPEYGAGIKAYQPDTTALDAIRKSKKPVEIEAYFGTWCPHCKMYMPKFLRVMQDAPNPNIKLTLVGVPKGFGNEQGPWQGKNIQSIPAIIVKYEGRELTRMASHEGAQPETELAALLAAIK